MSARIEIEINDKASPAVAAIRDELNRPDVKRVMGRAVAGVLRDYFYKLAADSQHHKTADTLGAGRTGFYERAAQGVQQPELESGGFKVAINHEGLAQRLFGGTIAPVSANFLTIPARTEAYGKRAGEFDNLRLILFPSGAGALVQREATVLRGGARGSRGTAGLAGRSKGEGLGGLVFFWLVKQVTQQPDPSVLPTEEEMLDPAIEAARDYLDRVWEKEAA
jgi:hypothetical protein